jgi:hypothetical protein
MRKRMMRAETAKAAKRRIALRELKEVRMRMLRRCELLTADHDPVIKESDELVRIVATVIRKSEGPG